jgi:hypothetical protein
MKDQIRLVFVLLNIALQAQVLQAQDRGGLNKMVEAKENSGVNADLKKRLANAWVVDNKLDPKQCKCWLPPGSTFLMTLNSDGTFTSDSWNSVKQVDTFGSGFEFYPAVFNVSEVAGSWSVVDFIMTLRFTNGMLIKVKVVFKSGDRIMLVGKYMSEKYGQEIDFNLPMIKSLVANSESSSEQKAEIARAISTELIGTWAYYEGKDEMTFEFKSDNTATMMLREKRRTIGSKYNYTFVTWAISKDGKRILMKDKYSSEEYSLEILAFVPKQILNVRDEDGVEVTLNKAGL